MNPCSFASASILLQRQSSNRPLHVMLRVPFRHGFEAAEVNERIPKGTRNVPAFDSFVAGCPRSGRFRETWEVEGAVQRRHECSLVTDRPP